MSRVLTATLRFPNTVPRDRRAALDREAIYRLGQSPAVSAVGAISTMFYTGDDADTFGLRAVEGKPAESRERWTAMTWSTRRLNGWMPVVFSQRPKSLAR